MTGHRDSDSIRAIREIANDSATRTCKAAIAPVLRTQTAIITFVLGSCSGFVWWMVESSKLQGVQDTRIESHSKLIDNQSEQLNRMETKLDRLIERQMR
jgi:hypothetical protein